MGIKNNVRFYTHIHYIDNICMITEKLKKHTPFQKEKVWRRWTGGQFENENDPPTLCPFLSKMRVTHPNYVRRTHFMDDP